MSEYNYYIILSIIIFSCIIMISAPHFPNSEVSEIKNKDAFLSLTIIGVLILIPFLYWAFKIFQTTTFRDLANNRSRSGTFVEL